MRVCVSNVDPSQTFVPCFTGDTGDTATHFLFLPHFGGLHYLVMCFSKYRNMSIVSVYVCVCVCVRVCKYCIVM